MPASFSETSDGGATRGYLDRLDELDLVGLFSEGDGHRFGYFLRQAFLGWRFKLPGDILFTLRAKINASYDLVLVDSRTGLNEVSGLCVGPLSNSLVICCGLNRQNIAGTEVLHACGGITQGR